MKIEAELWFKSGPSIYRLDLPGHQYQNLEISTERPDNSAKNGYHLVVTRTDHPNTEVVPPASPALPKTLPEANNLLCSLNIDHFGKVVGLLLGEGYAESVQCLPLLSHYIELVEVYDRFHRELRRVLERRLDQ